MSKTNQSVAIVYGFSEGAYHGRGLRKALRAHDYKLTHNLHTADIIIAHSAGCYLIPRDTGAFILHVSYTYWPGRRLFTSLNKLLKYEYAKYGFWRWLWHCIVHDVYILNISRTIRMKLHWDKRGLFLQDLPLSGNVFVRNQYDPYCEPNQLLQDTGSGHTYASLPGNHNHLWDEPEPYIAIIKATYES